MMLRTIRQKIALFSFALLRRSCGFITPLGIVAVLSALSGGAAPARAQVSQIGWAPITGIPADVSLRDVKLLGQQDAWAAGYLIDGNVGLVYHLHFQDGFWSAAEDARFGTSLHAIAVVSAQDIWAVGSSGLLVHKDASGWHEVIAPRPGPNLWAIWMLAGGAEGWAAGSFTTDAGDSTPLLLHYQSGEWQRDATVVAPADAFIMSLYFAGGVGWASGSHIWRYHDGTWAHEAMPEGCSGAGCSGFSGVRAVDDEHAWVVGSRGPLCAICMSAPYLAERMDGRWRERFPEDSRPLNYPAAQHLESAFLTAVDFSDAGNGFAVGRWSDNYESPRALLLHYRDGVWADEGMPLADSRQSPLGVSMADTTHALVVGASGLALSYGYMVVANPAVRVADPNLAGVCYFPEVGHTLRGAFRAYWERHGGLAQFGYPLTEEFIETGAGGVPYTTQYFERARFEYHPENAPPYDILLGLLGRTVTAAHAGESPFAPSAGAGLWYFPQTSHTLAPEFREYWQVHGGLAIYGYPISEVFMERNPDDGQTYSVQYFERARLEQHAANAGAPYEVLLGLLGRAVLRDRGLLP